MKKPRKDGEIGIVKHERSKGKVTEIVFTQRKGMAYIVSVNAGDVV